MCICIDVNGKSFSSFSSILLRFNIDQTCLTFIFNGICCKISSDSLRFINTNVHLRFIVHNFQVHIMVSVSDQLVKVCTHKSQT